MRIQHLRRSRRLRIASVLMALAYVGTYYYLSRRGMSEAPLYGLDGFLYVSCEEADRMHALSRHYGLRLLFAPINWVDYLLTGAPRPIDCIMHLSG